MGPDLGRRAFVTRGAAAVGGIFLGASLARGQDKTVMTVRGAVSPDELGPFLPHEHVMSSFGATDAQAAAHDRTIVFEAVAPYLAKVHALGCRTIADCTAAYFGRDPVLLKRLSERTGLNILTNTGYYGAANDRYVPQHAHEESPEQLADRWIREWGEGIGDSGIRPGFIKIGVDKPGLSEIDAKIVRAAAIAHLATGLTIAAHTGANPEAVRHQLAILKEEGVDPSAWIWVHAHDADVEDLLTAADAGGWIELDAIRPERYGAHLMRIEALVKAGHLSRILLSHDGNSYRLSGGASKPYDALFTAFVPMLNTAGFDEESVKTLTERNPARAFTVAVRLR